MKNSALACVTLIVAAFLGCKSRIYNANANGSEGKGAKGSTRFTGSPAYKETRPSAFAFTDKTTAAGVARLGFSPITPCDLMAWAELGHSKFDTIPEQLAKDYKASVAAGAGFVDYKDFAKSAKISACTATGFVLAKAIACWPNFSASGICPFSCRSLASSA